MLAPRLKPPVPRRPAEPVRGLAAWHAVAALLLAAVVFGYGWRPGFGACAWLGLVLLAAGLRCDGSSRTRLVAVTGFVIVADQWGHPWHLAFVGAYLPGGLFKALPAVLVMAVIWLGPAIAVLHGGWSLARRYAWPVWAWLPAAWWCIEALHDAITGVNHTAWLYSQWQSPLVLRAVAAWGWTPALLLALAICAAAGDLLGRAGEALWQRGPWRQAVSWPALTIVMAGTMLLTTVKPIRGAGPAVFAGMGAVHVPVAGQPVREVPPGIRMIVWPELTVEPGPRMAEGAVVGAVVEPPVSGPGVQHLIGVEAQGDRGRQNAVVTTDAAGRVGAMRAKSRLFPLGEIPFWGASIANGAHYVPGTASPVLATAGLRIGVLICLEAMDRALAEAARRDGASMLVIPTIEAEGARSELGQVNLLATCVLRAVETGLPVLRAAAGGCAAMIDRDGRILAQSRLDHSGVLTVAGDVLDRDAPLAPGHVAVLYSRRTPRLLPRLPKAAMRRFPIERFANGGMRADTVVVSGEAVPPEWLGASPEKLARAVASFSPRSVVLDTCFGASLQLLEALAGAGVGATVVAPAYRIPESGLYYEADFLQTADPSARAGRVRTDPPFPLLRWPLSPPDLLRTRRAFDRLDAGELQQRLKFLRPPMVRLNLPGIAEAHGRVLVWVPPERFGGGPVR